nr:PREDICTED: uncharacterized protein LOC109033201 isoform X1 [Bemisia tabaci]
MDLTTLKIFCVVSFLLSVSAAPKKFMPGGLHSQDVNDVKVKKYAKLALPTLESLSDPKEDLSLVDILEAHTQVIAGLVYHLKLKVADSRANEKICDVKIAVPHNGGTPEVYDPSCGNELLSRKQRSPDHWVGGLQPQSVADADVLKYAQFSLSSLEALSESKSKLKLVEVVDANTQVVSGSLYLLTLKVADSESADTRLCRVRVWVRTWLNKTEVTEASCDDKPSTKTKRSEKSENLQLVDKNSQEVQQISNSFLSQFTHLSATKKLRMVDIVHAHKEADSSPSSSGPLYHLKVHVADDHAEEGTKNGKICNVYAYVQASEEPKIDKVDCVLSSRRKRSMQHSGGLLGGLMLGGLKQISVNDPDVQRYAKMSMDSLGESEKKDGYHVLKVLDAREQVVSGTLYHIKAQIGTSEKDSKICNFKVWVQPWLHSEKITDGSCENKV